MWLRPRALQTWMIRFHETTSMGGWPVKGKMQHSSVPLRKMGRPFSMICVPRVAASRNPKTTSIRSSYARAPRVTCVLMLALYRVGENSSHGLAPGMGTVRVTSAP